MLSFTSKARSPEAQFTSIMEVSEWAGESCGSVYVRVPFNGVITKTKYGKIDFCFIQWDAE